MKANRRLMGHILKTQWILFGFIFCTFGVVYAQSYNWTGYKYGVEAAPTGEEWNNPELLALNKEKPKAWFFSFGDVESARKVLPENSAYWKSLNGEWHFHFAKNPDERPKDFYKPEFDVAAWDKIPVPVSWNIFGVQKNGALKYGVPIYVNQPVIFQHKVAKDDWRGGVMRTPPENWTTYEYRNEVGSFRRDFDIPANWDGREVFIQFDGADSFFYLWINGRYVGFSKNSRNAARFNITQYLRKGRNTVAAEVYRSSDGSFLEAQDMFRLPGIFRTVQLYSTPKVNISDIQVTPELTNNYTDGVLNIKATLSNATGKRERGNKIVYQLYAHPLYSDDNTLVEGARLVSELGALNTDGTTEAPVARLSLANPHKWSAEMPYRYTLVAELQNRRGQTLEVVSLITGFRMVELKQTAAADDEFGMAGKYYYLNGKTVKLRGVNRHETNPEVGHAITREMMEKEMMLLKRANINHVRNAHYPDDPYWYYLCDKYGIYLEDEANIESHQYYYGEASLSHPPEFKAAHISRVLEMAYATFNNPSVVIWSLGNEGGPGDNFKAAYEELVKVDKSRPVQYERNNNIVDIGSNQYPSIPWTREAVLGKYNIKYPFHISEYAHSMGNACGNLYDYWQAIESSNHIFGAAIWDWIDQAMFHYDSATGERFLAYGGDFGDFPNDGQFVMNGIIFADYTPKPQYFEVKKVYQDVAMDEVNARQGQFEIWNKFYFKNLDEYDLQWLLIKNGLATDSGNIELGEIKPRSRKQITVPLNSTALEATSEYHLKFRFLLKNRQPWADKGYAQAEEQFLLKEASEKPAILATAAQSAGSNALVLKTQGNFQNISGKGFQAVFNTETGTLQSLQYDGEQMLVPGQGPRLNALRAFVNNDNWAFTSWFENGLHNLKHKTTAQQVDLLPNGTAVLRFTVRSQAPNAARILGGWSSGRNTIEELPAEKFGNEDFHFTTQQIWTVYPDGSLELQSAITGSDPSVVLPRIGFEMNVPSAFNQFTYYGLGPADNYPDRQAGSFMGRYQSTVDEQFVHFPKPQDNGNHGEVRWTSLTNGNGKGIAFIATGNMSASALPWSAREMILARHPHRLPESGSTNLVLDAAVTGLGGNSCGQGGPLVEDRVYAGPYDFGFIIRPVRNNLDEVTNVSGSGPHPMTMVRGKNGMLKLHSRETHGIFYQVNGGQVREYAGEFNLRDGGKVEAWFVNEPNNRISMEFEKMTGIPLTVIGASSQEGGSESAASLVDGNPNTIWHTMYSVTVAKHPHWVDMDMGEIKSIKGFTYLPRQNGVNGQIKDYTLQVSNDGRTWDLPVSRGRFERGNKLQTVLFDKPVSGRYLRFTALNEHNNQDFASAAEFSVLEADK